MAPFGRTVAAILILSRHCVAFSSVAISSPIRATETTATRPENGIDLSRSERRCSSFVLSLSDDSNNNDDDGVCGGPQSMVDKKLQRPLVSLKAESILFSENPSTISDNELLQLWKFCKRRLPYLLTGATGEDTTSDENPLAGIYNMLLVRLPTVLAGCVYSSNLFQGHPLIVDMGDGPFVVNPLVVVGVLFVILR
mmetsp:Transcript_21530/g.44919  ORF Transcript_21530/g.44919 Transcript_21530/m.44919 type:complete len:196 (-) Transcript_21530:433-1020(-)